MIDTRTRDPHRATRMTVSSLRGRSVLVAITLLAGATAAAGAQERVSVVSSIPRVPAPAQALPATQAAQPEAQLADELKWLRAERVTAVTAALREEDLAHTSGTVRVITRRQIEERGYRSLDQLLRDQPGVDVLDHSQSESKGRIAIRGITGNNKFLILQDGIRVNAPTGEPITPIAENFPLFAAKQVEILYGPASALYGADAFTGVINIITETPTQDGTLRFGVEGGSFNGYRSDLYAAKQLTDTVAVSVGGHWQQSDGTDLSKAYPADVVLGTQPAYVGDFSSFSTHATVSVGENLTVGWQQSLFVAPTSESGLPAAVSYAARAENHTLLLTAYGRYKRAFGARAEGRVQLNYSRYEQLPASKFSNAAGGFRDAFKYGLGERFQIEPRFSVATGNRHTVTTGAVLDVMHSVPHTANLPQKYDRRKSPAQQGYSYPGTGGAVPIELFEFNYINTGGFAQIQTEWNPVLSTTVGVRVDHNQQFGSTAVNPRVGVVYQPSPRTSWKALYGRAYLAPSPFLRYENFGTLSPSANPGGLFTGGFFRVPNPDLAPERLHTVEASLSQQLGKRLTVTATGYATRVQNLTLAAPASAPNRSFIPGAVIALPTSNQNIGEADVTGVDVTVAYAYAGTLARLDVWSSASLLRGSLADQSLNRVYDLPFTAETMARAGLTFNYGDRLIVSASAIVNGSQAGFVTSDRSPNFQKRVPGYAIAHLNAELWNKGHRLAATVRVHNLLDNRYYNAGNSTAATYFRSPQEARSVQVGLRLRF